MSEYIVKDYGCVKNAIVYALPESIRGAKFPMSVDIDNLSCELTNGIRALAQSKPGSGHDQWLTGPKVDFDLSFTIKAWTEAERYGHFDFISSQSTMHRITKFDLDKAYIGHVDGRMVDVMKELVDEFNALCADGNCDPGVKQEKYLTVIYSNPVGFILTARMTTNYRQLKTIYSQRKNHRLPEWIEFCEWIKTLPHSELITGENDG